MEADSAGRKCPPLHGVAEQTSILLLQVFLIGVNVSVHGLNIDFIALVGLAWKRAVLDQPVADFNIYSS